MLRGIPMVRTRKKLDVFEVVSASIRDQVVIETLSVFTSNRDGSVPASHDCYVSYKTTGVLQITAPENVLMWWNGEDIEKADNKEQHMVSNFCFTCSWLLTL